MTSLAKYDEFEAVLKTTEKGANFLPDTTTKEGYEKSKRIALDGRKVWNAIDKTRKILGDDARQLVKDINEEGKKHLARVDTAITPHLTAYKDHDDAIKKEKEEFERKLTERVNSFCVPMEAHTMSSDELGSLIDTYLSDPLENFYTRTIEAGKARSSAVDQLVQLKATKILQEGEAKQLAEQQEQLRAQQEEAEKAQAVIDEARRIEDEAANKKAAELMAEAERKHNEMLKLEEDKRIKEALKQAEEDAKQAAIDAEKRAKEQAEAAAQAERDRIEEEKRIEAAEVAAREANKKHVGKIRKEAKESIMAVGITEDLAKKLVLAISKGDIKHTSIKY